MFRRLIEISNRPKRAPTRKYLLQGFAFQAALLLIILVVVTFWPERAPAVGSLVLLCLGLTTVLWLEAYEYRLGAGEPDATPK